MSTESPLDVLTRWSPRAARALPMLPSRPRLAVTQLYLCARGLDEIEDHPNLPSSTKVHLLTALADAFSLASGFDEVLHDEPEVLEVSRRLGEWRTVASPEIGPRIDDTMASLARRMAYWVERDWRIETERDFNLYIREISTTLFLLLDEILEWGTGARGDRSLTVRAGYALQVGNMASGLVEDRERGVEFIPSTWTQEQLLDAATSGRADIRAWIEQYQPGPAREFLASLLDGYS